EQDVVGILADLESVPHQRLGWSSWRATCQGFHILGFEGVKEMCRKLLLQGAGPGLERELPIRWRYQSAWSAVLTIRTRGLRLIVVVIGKISLWVHHIVVVSHCVGPVPLDVWLPVGQYRSVPVGFRHPIHGGFPPGVLRPQLRWGDQQQADRPGELRPVNSCVHYCDSWLG